MEDNPLLLPFLDLHRVGRHDVPRLQTDHVNFFGAQPDGGPGGVIGHVPPADNQRLLADLDRLAHVDILDELDSGKDPLEIGPLDGEGPAVLETYGNEGRFVSRLLEVAEREVLSIHGGIQPDLHPHRLDGGDLRPDQLFGQTVIGDSESHHPTRHRRRFEHRDAVTQHGEIMGRRQPRGAAPDDGHLFSRVESPGVPPGGGIAQNLGGIAESFHAVLLRHEPLERPDGDRNVDGPPAAGRLAGVAADAAANGGEGVGAPGDGIGLFIIPVGDGLDVPAGIGSHRAGGPALHEIGEIIHIRDCHPVSGLIFTLSHHSPRSILFGGSPRHFPVLRRAFFCAPSFDFPFPRVHRYIPQAAAPRSAPPESQYHGPPPVSAGEGPKSTR